MLPLELRERKRKLETVLSTLSGQVEIIPTFDGTTQSGEVFVQFRHSVRIRKALLRLDVREQFRDLDTAPHLFAFAYHVSDETDVELRAPIFRYECHPDFGDPALLNEDASETSSFGSHYERIPHFHPDNTARPRIRKLHFPFHRDERKGVIFALVEWLQVDLIRRFHESHDEA